MWERVVCMPAFALSHATRVGCHGILSRIFCHFPERMCCWRGIASKAQKPVRCAIMMTFFSVVTSFPSVSHACCERTAHGIWTLTLWRHEWAFPHCPFSGNGLTVLCVADHQGPGYDSHSSNRGVGNPWHWLWPSGRGGMWRVLQPLLVYSNSLFKTSRFCFCQLLRCTPKIQKWKTQDDSKYHL